MGWIKKEDENKGAQKRKGYVPLLVGREEEEGVERLLVHVSLLSEPCIVELLEMAAMEFGYRQHGILRIPCSVEHFNRTVDMISNSKAR